MSDIKWHKIPIDIYETHIEFCFVGDVETFNKLLENYSSDRDADGSYAVFFYDKDEQKKILFNIEHLQPKIIAHESFHATHYVMEEIGEEFNIDSHESFAWLNEYIFNSIYQKYLKLNTK